MVSILLPTYNRPEYLKEAISSFFLQRIDSLELIIIDDHSSGATLDYLHSLADVRIKVVSFSTNRGLCMALNEGIRLASRPIIQILNDDDRLPGDSTKRLLHELNSDSNLDAVFGAMSIINGKGKVVGENHVTNPEKHIQMMGRHWMWSKPMFRKSVVDKIGYFNPEYDRVEDIDFYLRLRQSCRIKLIPDIVYEYRVHSGGSMIERQHTYIIPSLKMRLHHIAQGSIRPDELRPRELILDKMKMAFFYGHPEIAQEVLRLVAARKDFGPRYLALVSLFYRSWFGRKTVRLILAFRGIKIRIRRLLQNGIAGWTETAS
jgi:glycosyltransferase involved in cell wall biosynthesis